MAEEEDTVPSPPSCPPQTTTTTLSKFLISLFPIILQVIAWTCAFSAVSYAISSAISFTYQVLSLKTANFLVILCTLSVLLLSRNNNDHNNEEEEAENIASTSLFRDQHIQYVQQLAQASHNSTSNKVSNSRMFGLRGFASCPDLRQESPWLTSNERWRSYNSAHLNDNLDQPHHGNKIEKEKEVVRQPLPPRRPPPPPLPPPSLLFGKVQKMEDGKCWRYWPREGKEEKKQEVKKAESLSNSQPLAVSWVGDLEWPEEYEESSDSPDVFFPSMISLSSRCQKDLSDHEESSDPKELFPPDPDLERRVDRFITRFRDAMRKTEMHFMATRSNFCPEPSFPDETRRKCILRELQVAENEVAPSIESGTDQKRSRALSLGTEPEIGNIQQEPMQSGTLFSLRQTDRLSEISPEARAHHGDLDQAHHGNKKEKEKEVVRQPPPPPPPLPPSTSSPSSSLFGIVEKMEDGKCRRFRPRGGKEEKQQEVKKAESLSNSQPLAVSWVGGLERLEECESPDVSIHEESSDPKELLPPRPDWQRSVDSSIKRSRDGSRMNRWQMERFSIVAGRRIKLRLGKRKDAENEVAPSIESGADQKQSRALSLGTEPDIGNIQQEPMQSGTLSSLRRTDWPSEMSPEARAQTQRILMQGGTGLTTPPEHQEWEISTEIYLMDNEFSELPENLSCPVLKALFLNRNSRLRKIPESFFNDMPALHILNISRTRIKSLPKSLFRLINLKRLFLNHCELLMKLQPEIGQLTNLEILDLEGTRITNLPKEVRHLTALTCLKLSFDDPVNHRKELLNEVIPGGVLSALDQLEELLIDVSPDDKRWNASVIAVASEVCGLTTLSTIKFYFPQVELLSYFDWSNPEGESLSLSHFRLTVGHHIKRIMSQTPHDMELEMEQYDRCLKYVNGAGVPEEIKMVLQYATAFFLDRHTDIKTLTELGCENLMQLNWCMVGECNEIRAIINGDQMGSCSSSEKNIGLTALEYLHIYRMKNLRSIWEGHVLDNGFTSLKTLTLRTCPQLTTICTPELLTSFGNLEELLVDDCPAITSLVSCDNSEYEATHFLPKLKKVSLQYLPALASISNTDGISMPPTVEWMSVYCCPNLVRLPIHKGYHTSLRKIKGERSWWEALEWTSTQQHSWDDIFVPINACD